MAAKNRRKPAPKRAKSKARSRTRTPSRAADLARVAIVSPELLSILLTPIICLLLSDKVTDLAEQVRDAGLEVGIPVLTAPLALLIAIVLQNQSMLYDKEDSTKNEILRAWPGYHLLKRRALFSSLVGASAFVVASIGGASLFIGDPFTGAVMTLTSLAASATSLATVVAAKWKLNDIIHGRHD